MIDPTRDLQNNVSTKENDSSVGGHDAAGFIRVGADGADAGSNYFLDLADGTGRAVKIRAKGWSVVKRPGMRFRRPIGLLPLPVPNHKGSIDGLRAYVNLTDNDFRRAIIWLASALVHCGPHPILLIRGDEGTAKSTLARVLTDLIDPYVHPLLPVPENARDLISTAVGRWVLAYDDAHEMPAWFSRALCKLARSPGAASASVLSGNEPSASLGGRPIIVSGIETLEEQPELSDLAIGLRLPPILFDDRRGEREFWKAFHADHSRILGGLLDVLTEGLGLAHAERRPA
jgi:hypothetical protein